MRVLEGKGLAPFGFTFDLTLSSSKRNRRTACSGRNEAREEEKDKDETSFASEWKRKEWKRTNETKGWADWSWYDV